MIRFNQIPGLSRLTMPRATIYILLAVIGFSFKPIIVKLIYAATAMSAVELLGWRMLASLPMIAAIGLYLWLKSDLSGVRWQDATQACALGVLGYYVASILDLAALRYISASLERIVLFVYPCFTLILFHTIRRLPLNPKEIMAMCLSYAGILVAYQEDRLLGGNVGLGVVLVLLSALSFALYFVFSHRTVQRMGNLNFTTLALLSATVVSVGQAVWQEGIPLDLSLDAYGLIALLAIFGTVLPVYLTTAALGLMGPTRTALFGLLGPVITLTLASLFLNEAMSLFRIGGLILVLSGVFVLIKKPLAAP